MLPGDCSAGTTANIINSYDFEAGSQGWTSGTNSGPDTWILSNLNPATNSTQHWHVDDQDDTSDSYLTSPIISLPLEMALLTFQFQNYQEIEDDGNSGGCWDGGILEISIDGGPYTQIDNALLSTDPYDGILGSGPLSGSPAWCGDPQAYLNSVVDINSYAGSDVQFRFRISTDSSVGRNGWDIDNILIKGCEVPELAFFDGFEDFNPAK